MTRNELVQKHGTFSEFQDAIMDAYEDMFITWEEALDAIEKYRIELSESQ